MVCSACDMVSFNLKLLKCFQRKLYLKLFLKLCTKLIILLKWFKSIESNEFIKAENKYFHFEHFTCWNCEKSLGGKKYIAVDSKPYCFDCHLIYFSKVNFKNFIKHFFTYSLNFIEMCNMSN